MPDFFIAGVPKAGTTALHVALTRHPALYMSAVKEPKFFLTDGPPSVRGGPGDAKTSSEHIWRRADYEALSDSAPAGVLRGESTPFYLYNRDAQRRIRAQTPDAKLIVVLRDPVERAHSNWTHLWSAGLEPIGDVVQACAEEDRRIAAGWAEFWHYTSLASITTAALFPVVAGVMMPPEQRPVLLPFLIAAALLIVVKHRENIRRLLAGTENRLDLKRR